MESWNSRDCEYESPSQENLAHPQTIKRDGESLEDFEDITKDEPTMKDLTAQFLQFETGEKNKREKEEFVLQDDDLLVSEPKNSNYGNIKSNTEIVNQMPKDLENLVILEPPSSKISDDEEILNNLDGLEQTDVQAKEDDVENFQEKPTLLVLDKNKLEISNDEVSTGSDVSLNVPKNEESSVQNSDSEKALFKAAQSESEPEELHNTQSLPKFTLESGTDKEEDLEVSQRDESNVKQNVEDDGSDHDDDYIPDPIPKDYPEIGAIEGKQFLAAIGLDTWFHPDLLHPKVESLIYWRDPKKSGIVFGGILIVLLSLTAFSLISVLAYTSLIALHTALAFRIYKSVMQAVQKTSEGHPFKEYLDIDLTLSPEKAREISDLVVSYMNKGLTECRRLFLIEDVVDSIKFGVLLWSFTYIGAWFNGLSLLIIAFVGLFTLPKVYENNKTQIDANMDVVKAKINEVTEKITAVIPLGKKTEEIKDKAE